MHNQGENMFQENQNELRLDVLEKQLLRLTAESRWLKRSLAIVLCAPLLVCFLAAADSKPDRAEVKAERFVLVNKKGEERGEWTTEGDAALFVMKTKTPSKKICVAATENDVAFLIIEGDKPKNLAELSTHNSKARLIIRDKESDASISLHSFKNGAVVGLNDGSGKPRLEFGANDKEASIRMKDAGEKTRLVLKSGEGNAITLYRENENPEVNLVQSDKIGSGLFINHKNGKPLIWLGFKMPDTPELIISNVDGKPLFWKP